MKSGVVILCRYSSSRLPGKILKEIQGKAILTYILERVSTVVDKDLIVVATSMEDSDDPIATYCQQNGWACFRGSLENVSRRFYDAGRWKGWDYATRINGDNIFVATDVLADCLTLSQLGSHDFISNVDQRTFPKGMSVETVKLDHYKALLPEIEGTPAMEHVTQYMYQNPKDGYHYVYNQTCPEAAGVQFAVDTQEDFDWANSVVEGMGKDHLEYGMAEIWARFPRSK